MAYRPETHGRGATQRREALIRAAVELVGERGVGGVTHRAVAERAGLPPSTTSYFFASINDLLSEALQTGATQAADEWRQAADAVPAGTPLDAIASAVAQVLMSNPRIESMAQVEAELAAARGAALGPTVRSVIEQMEATAEVLLASTGSPSAGKAARAAAALADGFVLHHLAHPRPDDEVELTRALVALVVAYTMDDAETDEWRDWLAAAPRRGRLTTSSTPADPAQPPASPSASRRTIAATEAKPTPKPKPKPPRQRAPSGPCAT